MIMNVTKAQLQAIYLGERCFFQQAGGVVSRIVLQGNGDTNDVVYQLTDNLTVVQLQAFMSEAEPAHEVTKIRATNSEA